MLFVLTIAAASSQTTTVSVTLTLAPVRQEVAVGRPILLKLTLKNVSPEELSVEDSDAREDYKLMVKDKEGHEAPLTDLGKFLRRPHTRIVLRNVVITLKPGEQTSQSIDIAAIYDLREPGKYFATAIRDHGIYIAGKAVGDVITSNPVEINVTK